MESPFREPIPRGTRLIETFGWIPGEGIPRLDLHLERMCRSATALGMPYRRQAALDAIAVGGEAALRCRLTLGAEGFGFSAAPLGLPPATPWRVAISTHILHSDDPWLAHKTTQRKIYDTTRAELPDGVDEVLFVNQRGDLCEGTITSVFVEDTKGRLLTPPLSAGVLPGVLRRDLIDTGRVQVARIRPDMLGSGTRFWVGNALRGLIPATLAKPVSRD